MSDQENTRPYNAEPLVPAPVVELNGHDAIQDPTQNAPPWMRHLFGRFDALLDRDAARDEKTNEALNRVSAALTNLSTNLEAFQYDQQQMRLTMAMQGEEIAEMKDRLSAVEIDLRAHRHAPDGRSLTPPPSMRPPIKSDAE